MRELAFRQTPTDHTPDHESSCSTNVTIERVVPAKVDRSNHDDKREQRQRNACLA